MSELQLRGAGIELTNLDLAALLSRSANKYGLGTEPNLSSLPQASREEEMSDQVLNPALSGKGQSKGQAGNAWKEAPLGLPVTGLLGHGKGLTSLSLSGLPLVSDVFLWLLARHHGDTLAHLNLERCGISSRSSLTFRSLSAIEAVVSQSYPKPPANLGLSKDGLLEMLQACKNLQSLRIHHCCEVIKISRCTRIDY